MNRKEFLELVGRSAVFAAAVAHYAHPAVWRRLGYEFIEGEAAGRTLEPFEEALLARVRQLPRLYRDYPVTTAGGLRPDQVLMFNRVGGSTVHWEGHFPRFHARPLRPVSSCTRRGPRRRIATGRAEARAASGRCRTGGAAW